MYVYMPCVWKKAVVILETTSRTLQIEINRTVLGLVVLTLL